MAGEEQAAAAAAKSSSAMSWVVTGVVALAAGAAGFAFPYIVSQTRSSADASQVQPARRKGPRQKSTPAFISFGELVVNLAEERLTRYISVKLTLQVDENDVREVSDLVEKHKAVLRNWLIGYLSDKRLDDVRGTVGVNRLRREILEHFNAILFPDGYDKIQDVLFEDFKVQ